MVFHHESEFSLNQHNNIIIKWRHIALTKSYAWNRYFYDFGNKWMISARGDIGGFGVGCDFTWNVAALVHFQPWKNVAIVGGYRALDQDYEDGSGSSRFAYDMRLAGPLLGFNIVW